ncbi:uncharacterized isomerase BH0283-like isoform X2 [Triticum dicoccoides]|uniref:Uncharacterized protein n=1 Tax=Triticum turgidum subsp. durum TaxID=4567 RepID=A0A9R0QSP7_TRITD|nr:uncharacterized isomerase BH0283-like isoform X2 [Triticum dicoccoides]VAH14516.1 unnamed protein product [Triticum turgidum subsp. durum]
MANRAVQYAMVDAFTGEPFKGNPAAVCLLDDEAAADDDRWLQSVAAEFNVSQTAFLSRRDGGSSSFTPRFRLRWFSPATEVPLCGHGTLASAHLLFTAVLAKQHDVIEFVTESGVLTARKVPVASSRPRVTEEEQGKPFIELDFPTSDVLVDCSSSHELPSIFLKAAPVVGVHRAAITDDFIVELSSGEEVADVLPNLEQLKKCAGRGVIVTGQAPPGCGYDFFSRFFAPKKGVDEDPVCGSAHCALAPYWARKLGKQRLTAF